MTNKHHLWLKIPAGLTLLGALGFLCFFASSPPPVVLTIFHTSDLHGHFGDAERGETAGLPRLLSALRREREKAGGPERCLTIDCGDALQGSPIAAANVGKPVVEYLNAAAYDCFVPGNHDFDYGVDTLRERLGEIASDKLAANLRFAETSNMSPLPWKLYEKSGLRIAAIGLTSPFTPYWLWGKNQEGYAVTSLKDAVNRIMPEVNAAKPDLIILAAHQGKYASKALPAGNDLGEIAREYPGIVLVLGGHSHVEAARERLALKTCYFQPGKRAEKFLKIRVSYDARARKVLAIDGEFVVIGNQDPVAEDLMARTATYRENARRTMETRVGETVRPLAPKGLPGVDNDVAELICASMAASAGTAAAINGPITGKTLIAGDVLYGDLYELEPFEDTIVIIALTRAEAIAILREQLALAKKADSRVMAPWGFKAELDARGDIVALYKPDGTLWKDTREKLRVAVSSFAVAGAGNRCPVFRAIAQGPSAEAMDTGVKIRDALAAYCRTHSPLNEAPKAYLIGDGARKLSLRYARQADRSEAGSKGKSKPR